MIRLLQSLRSALIVSVATASLAHSASLNYGMSFTFNAIDTSKTSQCPSNPDATIVAPPFLMNYSDPSIRQTVKQQLAAMWSSGFSMIRTLIEFGTGNISPYVVNIDQADTIATALNLYAQDVFGAGFKQLFIVYSPQGVMSPAC